MPAARLLGTDGVAVNTDNATGLNMTTGVTLAMWEKVEGSAQMDRTLFGHGGSVSDALPSIRNGYGLTVSGRTLMFHVGAAATKATLSAPLPPRASGLRWHHYAVTFDNTTGVATFYFDGAVIGSGTTATVGTTTATTKTYLGLTATVTNVFDVQVYVDQVRTPDQIRRAMRPNVRMFNATARWFGLGFRDPGASAAILDETGNGNSLTSSSVDYRLMTTAEPDWRGAARNAEVLTALGSFLSPTLVFTQQPPNTWDGEVPRQAVIVTKTTDGSTTDTGFTGTITLTKASGTGTIGGTVAVSAVAGIATLPAWTMTGSGTHTLQASDGTLTVVSNSFKVATGTGVPGGGVIILGGQMQRAMKDAETTAARKRVFFDIRDSAGAGWAGSVTGVKAKRSLSGATVADTTNDIVRVGGALHYVELDNTEAASGAAGDIIACYVPADTGRLESTHGFYEITADDVAAAGVTDASVTAAVLAGATATPIAAAVQTMAANSVTASALATDAVTKIRDGLLNWVVFTGFTLARVLRIKGIVLRGTLSGGGTTTETMTAPAGGATVTATVDASGNRTVVSDTASGTP